MLVIQHKWLLVGSIGTISFGGIRGFGSNLFTWIEKWFGYHHATDKIEVLGKCTTGYVLKTSLMHFELKLKHVLVEWGIKRWIFFLGVGMAYQLLVDLPLNRSRSSQLSCLGSGIPSLVGVFSSKDIKCVAGSSLLPQKVNSLSYLPLLFRRGIPWIWDNRVVTYASNKCRRGSSPLSVKTTA